MTVATYIVQGMTCGHCVQTVTGELSKLPGVTEVEVDLDTGEVSVTSDAALDVVDVKAAVDEAGYEVVS